MIRLPRRIRVIGLVLLLLFFHQSNAFGQIPCDINLDGTCNCQDIDPLNAEIASGEMNLFFDLDGNGEVNFDDKVFYFDVSGLDLADLDLDGQVNFNDLNILLQNLNSTSTSHCSGDINADSQINESDLLFFLNSFNGGILTWSGAKNNSWQEANNWDPAIIPFNGIKVVIPNNSSNSSVILAGNIVTISSLLIESLSGLTIKNDSKLILDGSVDLLIVLGQFVLEPGAELDVVSE
ncbi:MAG: hypothetical protein KDC80_20480 [Saprospiraceae bacterium]|nr:hypothetical protein [Saprospiraceae bacterium]